MTGFLAIGTTSAQSKSGLIRRIGRGVPNGISRVVLNAYHICTYVETYSGMAKISQYSEAYIVFMWRGFSSIFYMKVPDFSYTAMNNTFHSPPWSMHLPNLSIL